MAQEIFTDERAQAATIDRLRAMSLSEFRFEHTWLKVESKLLPSLEHGEIFIASDNDTKREIKAKHKSAVVYLPAELKRILDLDPGPEAMKAIHAAKAILGGRVIETKRRERKMSKGRKNTYQCQDNKFHSIITVDLEDGVTPFMIPCVFDGCRGTMWSGFYPYEAQSRMPTHEWYKPLEPPENPDEREHWEKGGLTLRLIGLRKLTGQAAIDRQRLLDSIKKDEE